MTPDLNKNKIWRFLKLNNASSAKNILIGTCFGIIFYVLLDFLTLPYYLINGLIRIQVDLALIVVPVVAVFCGPIAGFLAGFIGSLLSDALYNHQIVAFGLVNLSAGLVGFFVGIPTYDVKQGLFGHWKTLAKFLLFTVIGVIVASIFLLLVLVTVANQSIVMTLLYNFLPFLTVSAISLLFIAPIAVEVAELILTYTQKTMIK